MINNITLITWQMKFFNILILIINLLLLLFYISLTLDIIKNKLTDVAYSESIDIIKYLRYKISFFNMVEF